MLVSVTPFDAEHPEVQLYKLRHGLYEVDIINFGAIIVKFLVPDKNGEPVSNPCFRQTLIVPPTSSLSWTNNLKSQKM